MANQFRYSYAAQVTINKEKELVWEALTNLDDYHLWNPFTPKVEAKWQIGEPVTLTVQMKHDRPTLVQKEFITNLEPNNEISWGMHWRFLLKAERVQKLYSTEAGKTTYFTEDVIEGILSPIVHLIYGHSIQAGFNSLAIALKKHLES